MARKYLTTGKRQSIANPIWEKEELFYSYDDYTPIREFSYQEMEDVFLLWLSGEWESTFQNIFTEGRQIQAGCTSLEN